MLLQISLRHPVLSLAASSELSLYKIYQFHLDDRVPKDHPLRRIDFGTAAAWLMDGPNATFVGAVGPFNPGPSWEIKGTGDFNGDGKSDIIWQGDDGTAAMWLMDGTNATFVGAVGLVGFNPGPNWDIVI
jgi:hypothetical protein